MFIQKHIDEETVEGKNPVGEILVQLDEGKVLLDFSCLSLFSSLTMMMSSVIRK